MSNTRGGKRVVNNRRRRRRRAGAYWPIFLIVILLLLAAGGFFFLRGRTALPLGESAAVSETASTASESVEEPLPAETGTAETSAPVETTAPAESEEPAATETPEETAVPEESALPEETAAAETETTGTSDSGEFLILANRTHAIPSDWVVQPMTLSNGKEIDERIYPDLQRMFDDMRAEGVYPIVASGYRTREYQQQLMDEKIASFVAQGYTQEDAEAEALLWVAQPGYSEHETGLAVDINADGVNSVGTDVYNWLAEHAWEYGFILRYPEGKTDITGIDYEPWHYRYVGYTAAKEIYEQQITLEEYLGEVN